MQRLMSLGARDVAVTWRLSRCCKGGESPWSPASMVWSVLLSDLAVALPLQSSQSPTTPGASSKGMAGEHSGGGEADRVHLLLEQVRGTCRLQKIAGFSSELRRGFQSTSHHLSFSLRALLARTCHADLMPPAWGHCSPRGEV